MVSLRSYRALISGLDALAARQADRLFLFSSRLRASRALQHGWLYFCEENDSIDSDCNSFHHGVWFHSSDY